MLRLWLLRHGETMGNRERRYIGVTDEPLSVQGEQALRGLSIPQPEAVYTSPMLRCVQTARLLFPGQRLHILEELSECDFGEFENKNHLELSGDPRYQAWIDSQGRMAFPGGESREAFRERSRRGFQKAVAGCIRKGVTYGAVVAHGGTIMNLMEEFAQEPGDFYHWHVGNGGGYLVALEEALWEKGRRSFRILEERRKI
ncbi:MAG: histidine phosphatase family protein [Eubacteriales bacterium]|nr:histidine phosphatase family protein [Eubacteriales bacterium]